MLSLFQIARFSSTLPVSRCSDRHRGNGASEVTSKTWYRLIETRHSTFGGMWFEPLLKHINTTWESSSPNFRGENFQKYLNETTTKICCFALSIFLLWSSSFYQQNFQQTSQVGFVIIYIKSVKTSKMETITIDTRQTPPPHPSPLHSKLQIFGPGPNSWQ